MTTSAAPPRHARRWALRLRRDALSAGRARAAIGDWLAGADPALRVDAVLIASELVANAVKYGRPPILLCAELDAERLRLEVCDAGTQMPRRRRPGPDGGGWGLPIVHRLAERWGAATNPTRVWCELRVGSR